MTDSEKLSPEIILAETNMEVRRELIRKIGVERFIQVSGATVLNKSGDYELLAVDLSPECKAQRFLKMLNPSIGVWHVEAVSNECMTVEHANNWRWSKDINKKWSPSIVT